MASAEHLPPDPTTDEKIAEEPLGPVFISGRQHSGNTLMAFIFDRMNDCFSIDEEGVFFPHRRRLDGMKDPVVRATWIASHLKLRDQDPLAQEAVDHLAEWARIHPKAPALEQYLEVMRFVTERAGCRFFAQKGTAYIFHGREILDSIPNARFIYLLRNPYDVCASKKRRRPERERIVGWVLSWNKGIRLVEAMKRAEPDRTLLIRYEDLVQDPKPAIEEICRFVGVPFEEEMLNVPHVNPSDAKFQVVEGSKGINQSRLFYYVDRLHPAEVAGIDLLVAKQKLHAYYPDLPHLRNRISLWNRIGAVGLVLVGFPWYLRSKIRFSKGKLGPTAWAWLRQRMR